MVYGLQGVFATVCVDFEAELVQFAGKDDHIHLLVNYQPKVGVSASVNSLKGASTRILNKKNHPSFSQEAAGRCAVVIVLLRRKLWWRAIGSAARAIVPHSATHPARMRQRRRLKRR
jgi:REP element-mobilizing transposase RayT